MILKSLTYLIVLLTAPLSMGQQLLVEISNDAILVGEPTTLKFTVKAESQDTIKFNPKQKEIDARLMNQNGGLATDITPLEIVYPFIDTFIFNGSAKKWKGEYVLTSWEPGNFVIPGATILINDSTYRFKDISLKCSLVAQDTTMDIYEIREGYTQIPDKPFSFVEFVSDNWCWLIIFPIAIMVFLIIRKLRKREDDDYLEEVKPLSLKERTILAINSLEKEELWSKDKLKEHFIELSYILRSYLTNRYSISLLDKTTYEIKLLLTKQGLNEETVDVIARILSQSDMVKFAKSKPDVIAIIRQSTLAKQIIAETSPLDFNNVD